MRFAITFIFAAAFLLSPTIVRAKEPDFLENRHVVILSVYKDFTDARADAEKIAKASRVPFSMEGRVYEKRRGLIYPDNFADEIFRGQYVSRRYHKTVLKDGGEERQYLSVERSDGYDGFKKGFYIVVAGIHADSASAQADAKRFAAWAPTAYAKKTRIYMGCMH
jgi:hypothetical protein